MRMNLFSLEPYYIVPEIISSDGEHSREFITCIKPYFNCGIGLGLVGWQTT